MSTIRREAPGKAELGNNRAVVPVRNLAVVFLVVEGAAVIAWWSWLLIVPSVRSPFMAPGAPDSTLLAFFPADILFYAGSGLLAAYGLARKEKWAWPLLCFHTGAACYAALYALSLLLFSGGGALGAVMMLPALVVLPIFTWLLRPRDV